MKKQLLIIVSFLILAPTVFSQPTNYIGQESNNTITTAVPFLMIGPDARSGGMGETGVASTPDAFSMHWNPAKYAFIEKDMGFSVSYSPWLRELVSDINLAYLNGFYKIDSKSAVGMSLLYFSLGDITFTDIQGEIIGNFRPNEWALDAAYARKFSEYISGSVSGRFIYSNLTQGQFVQGTATKAGTSIATDVAVFYNKELIVSGLKSSKLAFGVNISNIGAKISYSNDDKTRDFIPTNLRIGSSYTMDINDYASLAFNLDFNKLLVPTPPIYERDSASGQPLVGPDGKYIIQDGLDPDVSIVGGMLQSFYDAPDGIREEFKEFVYAAGVEFWYDKQFAIRGGYFHESAMKGNRKFFTMGAGLRLNAFGLDFSYLIPTDQQNPLQNTLRFSLTFDMARTAE